MLADTDVISNSDTWRARMYYTKKLTLVPFKNAAFCKTENVLCCYVLCSNKLTYYELLFDQCLYVERICGSAQSADGANPANTLNILYI